MWIVKYSEKYKNVVEQGSVVYHQWLSVPKNTRPKNIFVETMGFGMGLYDALSTYSDVPLVGFHFNKGGISITRHRPVKAIDKIASQFGFIRYE